VGDPVGAGQLLVALEDAGVRFALEEARAAKVQAELVLADDRLVPFAELAGIVWQMPSDSKKTRHWALAVCMPATMAFMGFRRPYSTCVSVISGTDILPFSKRCQVKPIAKA
jgi:hypothetical protein